ncbi:class I SAM-dependent methyltransferase [Paeniglutamicibacter psychrophenolicus]|uniref:class I SAM-dependent methyltransferase n=1 Tax=Paeniglutamicibacter psychrophenolicus TaxID=257454 RepID=UPI00278322E2|nr:class I SAM-dependent methyltransferase [Paeniglutamicibacter psychrophenolicus]MDQ0093853.1 SAM-dependent methyltransferase [Paeniglutamicibacter psychrophenolicus]
MNTPATISFTREGEERSARWSSANDAAAPRSIQVVDDALGADEAYRLAAAGTGLLFTGDYHNARQLLGAIARRIPDGTRAKPKRNAAEPTTAERFYKYRQARTQRARVLAMLLVPVDPGPVVPLRRAPDVSGAWLNAFGPVDEPTVVSLQELLGAIGAQQWRATGLHVPALGARIHPHYGTFAPVRGEYLDLVARAELPGTALAFDIGTGTGVLAAILAQRGVGQVTGTDSQARAVACANANLEALGLSGSATAIVQDMYPQGKADVVVCNPPWLPGTPQTLLDYAVYDPKSAMLRAFLRGLPAHLSEGGQGWLVISDLAERLGLRTREQLLGWIEEAGLVVRGRDDTVPSHGRAADASDPFHAERSAEVTSLWKLEAR